VNSGVLHLDGEPLTSERVRSLIARTLMERACTARHTIVACGDQACDPHNHGSGPLRADLPVVIDIFPRSDETGYYSDMTRTVVRGEASGDLVDIYDAVLEAQLQALDRIRAGVDGRDVHQGVSSLFESRGFLTGLQDGRMQGFFHGTGHGVGLDIHEPPRVGKASDILEPGHVVSVEPGLYYTGRGAVRIEDLVVVTEAGCDNLTDYPKSLII
jgi:Xaa-Pro aminopeptidase